MTHYFLVTSDNDDIIVPTKSCKSTFIKNWNQSDLKYNSIIELSPGEFLKLIEERACFIVSLN